MAWNQNGLTMQVSGVDLAEQSTYAAGNLNLQTSPAMDSGYTTFQQRLSLYDGTLTTKYDSNRTVTVLGSPNSEVMGVHVEDSRGGVGSISLELSLWDMNTVQNIADVPDLNTWRTVSTFADSTGVGLSRGQTDANGFGYTFAATVEGAAYSAQTVNGTRVRLNITPSSSYTIWFTAASRINAPSRNSVQQAKNQLAAVKSTGYGTTLTNYKNWWHSFWQKSFVQYNAGGSDYLENVYYLSTYMIAAGGYGNYPLHFINGVFRATQDNSKWSNGYWYWNQRDVYNSFYSANHPELMRTFNNLYARNLGALKSYTVTRYNTDSLWVPETMGWDGNARGTVGSDYVNDIYSTGTEAAYNMYLYYRYTNDANYLRDVAYPFMKDSARFYQNRLSRNGSQYYMASSNSHETYWDVRNAITDLAAVRLLFPLTIQVSTQLGLDSGLRAGWQDVLNNLAPYQVQNGAYLPHDPPISQTRNNENVALELVWPYDQTGIGYADTSDRGQDLERPPVPVRQRLVQRPRARRPARPRRAGVPGHADDAPEIPELPERDDQQHQRRLRVPRHPPGRDERVVDAVVQRQDPGLPGDPQRLRFRRQVLPAGQGRLPRQLRAGGRRDQVRRDPQPVRQAGPRGQPVGHPADPGAPHVRQRHHHDRLGRRGQLRDRRQHHLRGGAHGETPDLVRVDDAHRLARTRASSRSAARRPRSASAPRPAGAAAPRCAPRPTTSTSAPPADGNAHRERDRDRRQRTLRPRRPRRRQRRAAGPGQQHVRLRRERRRRTR